MEYVQPWREKRRRRWLSRRGARRQNRFWKGKVACTCQQRGFTYTQYAHDSRQKRVGGKTAAAPNKGCSTPRTLRTADRTNAPVRRARSYSNTPTCRARVYTCNANELAEKPANIHVHARPGWCLFFSAHEYLFPIHVWTLEGKFASRFGVTCVHTYIYMYIYIYLCTGAWHVYCLLCYACVCMPRTCIRCLGSVNGARWWQFRRFFAVFKPETANSPRRASRGLYPAFSSYFDGIFGLVNRM